MSAPFRSTGSGGTSRTLSKSRVARGMQCSKALWLWVHARDLATPATPDRQASSDNGNLVGKLARERFGNGLLIDVPHGQPREALARTRAAIEAGATALFEPAFEHEGVLVRVDVLHRAAPGTPWHLVEVKSSTGVKDEHLPDLAVQAWVLTGCGERLAGCHLMHVNGECEHPDLEELFTIADVTGRVRGVLPEVPDLVARCRRVLAAEAPPDVDIGPHCNSPRDCDFAAHCRGERNIPEWSVFDVRSLGSRRTWALYREGVVDAADVQARLAEGGFDAGTPQGRSAEALATGRRFVQAATLRDGLAGWSHPRMFLDFETLGGALPRFAGTRPYANVPFQYSAHVRRAAGAPLEHFEYLHADDSDPRPELAAALAELSRGIFGRRGKGPGCVVAYNKAFEHGCLDRLAQACPEHGETLANLARRLVDPLPLLRTAVYDRGFRTSYSLKAVAPALLGDGAGYEHMAVADGTMAQVAFAEMVLPGCAPARRAELRAALLAYCGQDTLVLVHLAQWMEREGASAR